MTRRRKGVLRRVWKALMLTASSLVRMSLTLTSLIKDQRGAEEETATTTQMRMRRRSFKRLLWMTRRRKGVLRRVWKAKVKGV
eukprot:30239_1